MKARNLTKAAMARRIQTSRAQLYGLRPPENSSVTLHTERTAPLPSSASGCGLN